MIAKLLQKTLVLVPVFFFIKRMCASGGIIVSATIIDDARAKVFVYARGLKSFPSEAVIIKTGRKLTIVVEHAVRIAPPTSDAAR